MNRLADHWFQQQIFSDTCVSRREASAYVRPHCRNRAVWRWPPCGYGALPINGVAMLRTIISEVYAGALIKRLSIVQGNNHVQLVAAISYVVVIRGNGRNSRMS